MREWTTAYARDKLLNVICDVLGRRVRSWSMEFAEEWYMTTKLDNTSPQSPGPIYIKMVGYSKYSLELFLHFRDFIYHTKNIGGYEKCRAGG